MSEKQTQLEQIAQFHLREFIRSDLPEGIAERLVKVLRSEFYQEVADRLHAMCKAEGHGGDCALMCERGNIVILLDGWADQMDDGNG